MKADGEVRLPLQIGTSSVWSLARASAALFGGPALIAIAVSAFLQRHVNLWLCIPLALAGFFFFAAALLVLALDAWLFLRMPSAAP